MSTILTKHDPPSPHTHNTPRSQTKQTPRERGRAIDRNLTNYKREQNPEHVSLISIPPPPDPFAHPPITRRRQPRVTVLDILNPPRPDDDEEDNEGDDEGEDENEDEDEEDLSALPATTNTTHTTATITHPTWHYVNVP